MKYIYHLLIILLCYNAKAENFYPVKIISSTNDSIVGFASFPGAGKKIFFKSNLNSEKKVLEVESLTTLIYFYESDNKIVFERWFALSIVKSFQEYRNKDFTYKEKRKGWLLKTYESKNIKIFKSAEEYYIADDGTFVLKSVNRGTWASIYTLLKKPNENCAFIVSEESYGAVIIGAKKRFKKVTSLYFNDVKELVERIENDEFTEDAHVEKLVEAYENYLKN